jgi:translation elongation factor P/translation initiation factor 5A
MTAFVVIFVSQFFDVLFSQNTYEEIRLNTSDVGDKMKYLKEGMDCIVLFWNGKVFSNSINLCAVFSSLHL